MAASFFVTGREPPKTKNQENTIALEYITDIIYERQESPDEITSLEHLLDVMRQDPRTENIFKDFKQPWKKPVRYTFNLLLKADVIAQENEVMVALKN